MHSKRFKRQKRLNPTAAHFTLTDSKTESEVIPPEHMDKFKQTVEGCDSSKAGLIEVFKKR